MKLRLKEWLKELMKQRVGYLTGQTKLQTLSPTNQKKKKKKPHKFIKLEMKKGIHSRYPNDPLDH
jgi:hypothetical protein